jgi:RNA polymerase sigma-54 factor
MRRMKLPEEELRERAAPDPVPRSPSRQAIGADDTEYIVPDVFVRKSDGRWVVELNAETRRRACASTATTPA